MDNYKTIPLSVSQLLNTTLAVICLFFVTACNEKKFETCGGQPTCPPLAATLSPEMQKVREGLAGKWKFVSVTTRDSIHNTGTTYNTQRFGLCISYDGGILYVQDYKTVNCTYCYDLKKGATGTQLDLGEGKTKSYCSEALQSSDLTIQGDSMVLFRRDSFITKRSVFKRANDDWTFKTN